MKGKRIDKRVTSISIDKKSQFCNDLELKFAYSHWRTGQINIISKNIDFYHIDQFKMLNKLKFKIIRKLQT